MRNIFLILSLFIFNIIAFSQAGLKDSLISLMEKENCEYDFILTTPFVKGEGDSLSYGYRLSPNISRELSRFSIKNRDDLYRILCANLLESDLDWFSCVLLYYLTGQDALHLKNVRSCDEWRVIDKPKEISFWKKYFLERDKLLSYSKQRESANRIQILSFYPSVDEWGNMTIKDSSSYNSFISLLFTLDQNYNNVQLYIHSSNCYTTSECLQKTNLVYEVLSENFDTVGLSRVEIISKGCYEPILSKPILSRLKVKSKSEFYDLNERLEVVFW